MKNTADFGRTTIENILIIGGIVLIFMGVSLSMDKILGQTKSKALNQRITAMVQERRLHPAALSGGSFKRTEAGPHDTQLTIESGTAQNHPNEFWITIRNISQKSLVKEIKKYHELDKFITPSQYDSDKSELTLYFLKYPKT